MPADKVARPEFSDEKPACCVCGNLQRPLFGVQGYRYCRCYVCGLVSLNPIPDAQTIEDHYARKFQLGNYQVSRVYAAGISRTYQGFVKVLKEHVNLSKGPSILDVGCFTGDLLTLLRDEGADVYGLELQPEAVEIANARLPGRVFQADVYGDNFPQRQFDVITLTAVIEHVTNPMKFMERCTQLLKPDGLILIETPNSGSVLCRIMGRFWPPYAVVEHIHLFSSKSLRRVLKRFGYEHVTEKQHWKVLPLGYVYDMLQNFGPDLRRLIAPFFKLLPRTAYDFALPFYIGETIVTARLKRQRPPSS